MQSKGYDPLKYGDIIKKFVTRDGKDGEERLYSNFRAANYYRGAMTGDLIGCNLRCRFCWAENNIRNYARKPLSGALFLSPRSVATTLLSKAKEEGCKYLRVSQGEPTLSKDHIISVLQFIEKSDQSKFPFILETNGLILGNDAHFAEDLSRYKNLHIRISLKGVNSKKFEFLTGAKEQFFNLQLNAMQNCIKNGIDFHPAIMIDFIDTASELENLKSILNKIDPTLIGKLEFERLILYPHVRQRLKRLGISYCIELNQ